MTSDSELAEEVELKLEMPDRAGTGETVSVRLYVTNRAQRMISFAYVDPGLLSYRGAFDFIVTTRDGTPMWRLNCGSSHTLRMSRHSTIPPGEPAVFEAQWDLTDYDGNQVEPGEYHVYGVFRTGAFDGPQAVTEPTSLRMRRSGVIGRIVDALDVVTPW